MQKLNQALVIFGFSIAATTVLPSIVEASPVKYRIQSGTTSLRFEPEGVRTAEEIGQTFRGLENPVTPADGYQIGLSIIPPSSAPRSTDFIFSFDQTTGAFTPVSGTIELSGRQLFNIDTNQLSLPPILTYGDYTIGFDNNGLFLKDNVDLKIKVDNLPLNSPAVFDGQNLSLFTDIIVTPELNNFFASAGSKINVSGLKFGEAKIAAKVVKVTEPGSIAAVFVTAVGMLFALKRKQIIAQ